VQSPSLQARVAAPAPVANRVASAAPESSKPAFSPFAADTNRKRFEPEKPAVTPLPSAPLAAKPAEPGPIAIKPADPEPLVEAAPTAPQAAVVAAPAIEPVPPPVVEAPPEPPRMEAAPAIVEAPAAPAPEANTPQAAQPSEGASELQRVATEALMNAKSQGSAADALADAEWTIVNGEVRVQTELSKTMLPMVVNPEAEKIVRLALREAGAGALKLVLLPGSANAAAAKKPRPAKSGSVQAKAMEHPIVQQAQKLFDAEIRNVIDLREGD
jgi:DNA polymerase-3 subunit gamma/tau